MVVVVVVVAQGPVEQTQKHRAQEQTSEQDKQNGK